MAENLKFEDLLDLIRNMHMLDLSHTVEEHMPVYPTHPQYFHMEWNTGDPANMYQLLISEHAGTHLDCPAHFYGDQADPHHIPLEKVPVNHFINRAVVLDFQDFPADQQLSAEDIQRWEEANYPLRKNEAILFHFGWDRKWALLPDGKPYLDSWPGINRTAAEYLAGRRVRLVGTDCLGIDGSSTNDLGSHFVLLGNGILIVENLKNLDKVPSPFLLITLPMKIKEGTGSPIWAVGLFY